MPQRLSVVGFDDLPSSALVRPALTTVRQPMVDVGGTATRLLLRRLAGEEVADGVALLHPTLTVRETTAPPASEGS